ncbi:P-loop NTPase fold protein [Streptomyces sp. NPDC008141]|uniref:KAP family P-loop NTPase fold protein n=1 Tax=Streptomyces sp. NPDC008141 TaxID=3364815 RepID=UPI0036E51B60
MVHHSGQGALHPDDLIQDREVEDAQGDRLAHSHVADQLRDVALMVPAPSNVAVWGPWGSGKSGVANLLRQNLDRERGVRFVHFDAFKYAENPLRRNFIIAVATALGIKDERFHDELYSGRVTAKLKFSSTDVWRLLRTFGQMFGVIVALCAVVMAMLARVQGGPFRPALVHLATGALKAGLAPAALLTSLTVLVSRTFTREHKTDAADSDEQFERIFAELVERSHARRLVIFVDELDRCSPKDVVATLDALRTFLGVDKCVFIVAADQQAMEEALTRALEQATPADTVNPYYSSGSGYLDKVFQYQISLPPLLLPKVTRFAAGLVRGRQGLWADIDVDLVVSILVASHVRSPRRVKSLLNTFALTYRLAQRRAAEGLLESEPAARAEEIAKLVCLRVEFPLFARDLQLDHRLCEYVLAFAADENAELSPHIRPQVREAALRYAKAEAAVDQELSDPDGDDDEAGVRTHHAQQLVAYLKRTRTVVGPGRDLVFMETSGSIFGLPAALAEELEQLAQNADLDQLASAITSLPAADRPAALELLLQQVRDAIGLEETNIATAALTVCADQAVSLESLADAAAETLAPILTTDTLDLPQEALAGCWRLALASDRPAALEMRRLALTHPALDDDASLAAGLLASPQPALAADPQRVHTLVIQHLVGESDVMADLLTTLSPPDATAVMTLIGDDLAKQVRTIFETYEEWGKASSSQNEEDGTDDDEDEQPEPPAPDIVMQRLKGMLRQWCGMAPQAAHAVVGLLLGLDRQDARYAVELVAGEIPAVGDPGLARAVLAVMRRRQMPMWPRWLGFLDDRLPVEDLEESFALALEQLWHSTRAVDEPLEPALASEVADSFMRLFSHVPGEHPGITPFVLRELSAPASDAEAVEQDRLLSALQCLTTSGLLDRAAFVRHQAAVITELLADDGEPEYAPGGTMVAYLDRVIDDCLQDLSAPIEVSLDAHEAGDLARAVDDCDWLPADDHTRLRISARTMLADGGIDIADLASLPTPAEMAAFALHRRTSAGETLAGWIRLERPSPTGLLAAVGPAMRHASGLQTNTAMLQAVAEHLGQSPTADQSAFWRGLLSSPSAHVPLQTLTAAGWPTLPDTEVARVLTDRFSQTTRNSDRKAALELWMAAAVTAPSVLTELIERILIPMLEGGQESVKLAIAYLPQLMNMTPKAAQTALRVAMENAIKRFPQFEQRGIKALKHVGYKTKKTGLLRRERITDSNDE